MNKETLIKAGQRLAIGFEGTTIPDDLVAAIRQYKIGNIILFKRNIQSKEQVAKLCADLQALILSETGHPALIAIDQEGGTVSRLSEDCTIVPYAMALAAVNDLTLVREAGAVTGEELAALGINFDLAPVADVNSNPLNPVIGVRSFGDDPYKVAEFVAAMTEGLEQSGIPACAKHFPGHGDTAVDSHIGLPVIDKPLSALETCELIPFRRAIEAQISAIMTTHILFPQIEKEKIPATMSRTIVTDILRNKLGFDGLVVSDCMMMQAIASNYGTVNGCVAACRAGVDLVFVCHSPALGGEACEAIAAAMESGEICPEEVEASYERMRRIKAALPAAGAIEKCGCPEHLAAAEAMYAKTVSTVGNGSPATQTPCCIGVTPYRASQAAEISEKSFAPTLAEALQGTAFEIELDPDEDTISACVDAASAAPSILFGTGDLCEHPGQLRLLGRLIALQKPISIVALGKPYDLRHAPDTGLHYAVYEYSVRSLKNLVKVLTDECRPEGTFPVKLF